MAEKKEVGFEQNLQRLDEIIRLLEKDSVPLDELLRLYEEGVALVRLCNTRLDNAEQRVKILSFTESGEAIENDMTGGNMDAVH